MKKYIVLIFAILLILLAFFIYQRYKPRRLENIIGASKYRLEEYLHFSNNLVKKEVVKIEDADETIVSLIKENQRNSDKPLLRYTREGSISKLEFWLVDEGEGYYVFEAIGSMR